MVENGIAGAFEKQNFGGKTPRIDFHPDHCRAFLPEIARPARIGQGCTAETRLGDDDVFGLLAIGVLETLGRALPLSVLEPV